jgi:probable rRNA maturation factor
MNIIIRKNEKRWGALASELRSLRLSRLFAIKGTVTVFLADDAFVQDLNSTYRQKHAPTNVLSFANTGPFSDPSVLGDVVLAYETVLGEATQQNKPMINHCVHLVVHGILHLLGYDHETDDEAAIMEAKETDALKILGIPDPYIGSLCLNP